MTDPQLPVPEHRPQRAPSSAAPGHLTVEEPFERGIQRGVVLAAFALTFAWLVWAIGDLTSFVLPMLNLPTLWELPAYRYGMQGLSLLLDVALIVGVIWLTRWPGPAKRFRTGVRVAVIAGCIVPLVLRPLISVLGTSLDLQGEGISLIFQVVGLLGVVPLVAVVFMCSWIVGDRGHPQTAMKFRVWAGAYVAYRVMMIPLWAFIFFVEGGYEMLSVTRIISLVFLGGFLWVFTKTWRALV